MTVQDYVEFLSMGEKYLDHLSRKELAKLKRFLNECDPSILEEITYEGSSGKWCK